MLRNEIKEFMATYQIPARGIEKKLGLPANKISNYLRGFGSLFEKEEALIRQAISKDGIAKEYKRWTKKCEYCGKEFIAFYKNRMFCCKKCKDNSQRKKL